MFPLPQTPFRAHPLYPFAGPRQCLPAPSQSWAGSPSSLLPWGPVLKPKSQDELRFGSESQRRTGPGFCPGTGRRTASVLNACFGEAMSSQSRGTAEPETRTVTPHRRAAGAVVKIMDQFRTHTGKDWRKERTGWCLIAVNNILTSQEEGRNNRNEKPTGHLGEQCTIVQFIDTNGLLQQSRHCLGTVSKTPSKTVSLLKNVTGRGGT